MITVIFPKSVYNECSRIRAKNTNRLIIYNAWRLTHSIAQLTGPQPQRNTHVKTKNHRFGERMLFIWSTTIDYMMSDMYRPFGKLLKICWTTQDIKKSPSSSNVSDEKWLMMEETLHIPVSPAPAEDTLWLVSALSQIVHHLAPPPAAIHQPAATSHLISPQSIIKCCAGHISPANLWQNELMFT